MLRARSGGGTFKGMRAAVLSLLVACGPKVAPAPPAFDEDLGASTAEPVATEPLRDEQRSIAPQGKGLRTGTIRRDRLNAVLDAGPGTFLRQLEVTPRLSGERFVGWQLVQLIDRQSPLVDLDVAPGDVLLAINGQPLSRPDQLQTMWDSLRTANTLTAQLWRGDAKFALEFAIEPELAPTAVAPVPTAPPTTASPPQPTPAPAPATPAASKPATKHE